MRVIWDAQYLREANPTQILPDGMKEPGRAGLCLQDTGVCSIPGQAAPELGTGVSLAAVTRDCLTYSELKGEVKGAHANDIQTPGAISQLRPRWCFPRPQSRRGSGHRPQEMGAGASGHSQTVALRLPGCG